MKKLTAMLCVVSLLLAMTLGVTATGGSGDAYTININTTDVQNDIVTVKGAAGIDTLVSVRIYNPGFSGSNVNFTAETADTTAIQFFGTALSNQGEFSLDVPMNTVTGGEFTVEVSVGGTVYSDTFTFYPYAIKMPYVTMVKNATDATNLALSVPEIMNIYGYANHALYKATTPQAVANAIVSSNADATLVTPTDMDVYLKGVLVLTAYQAKNEAALFTNGKMNYADMLGIASDDWYLDYTSQTPILSAAGFAGVKSDLLSATYASAEDIKEKFVESMCYHAIMNNVYAGSGHVEGLLDKYDTDYTKAGFDLDLLETATGQNTLFGDLVASGATNLTTLAAAFNDLFDGDGSGNGNGNGGAAADGPGSFGGFGGGFGGGSPAGGISGGLGAASGDNLYIPADALSYPFADMEGADWAKEAVKALYDKKIINGKSATEYAPNDMMTRAEFVKIIAEAFEIQAGEDAAEFEDVPESAWYAPYVKRIASSGYIKGDGKNFSPEGNITRQDAAVIIARVLNLETTNAATFADAADIADYAGSAVAALAEKKIMNGMGDNMFAPKANLTRAEAAQLIYNILQGGALN